LTKLEEPNQTALFQTSLPSSPMCFFRKSLMPPHPASPPPLRLWTLLPDVIRSASLLSSPAFLLHSPEIVWRRVLVPRRGRRLYPWSMPWIQPRI
jgi:hypothetical protein